MFWGRGFEKVYVLYICLNFDNYGGFLNVVNNIYMKVEKIHLTLHLWISMIDIWDYDFFYSVWF